MESDIKISEWPVPELIIDKLPLELGQKNSFGAPLPLESFNSFDAGLQGLVKRQSSIFNFKSSPGIFSQNIGEQKIADSGTFANKKFQESVAKEDAFPNMVELPSALREVDALSLKKKRSLEEAKEELLISIY